MEATGKRVYPVNCVRLCFDTYGNHTCMGRICGVALQKSITFTNISDMTIKIDDAYNEIGQPQPYQVLRSFVDETSYNTYKGNPTRYYTSEEIGDTVGCHMTIELLMISRQAAEWQGMLRNDEGKYLGEFNTSGECIDLLKKIGAIA